MHTRQRNKIIWLYLGEIMFSKEQQAIERRYQASRRVSDLQPDIILVKCD